MGSFSLTDISINILPKYEKTFIRKWVIVQFI